MDEKIIKARDIVKVEKTNLKEKGFPAPLPKRKMTSFTGDEIKSKILEFLRESRGSKFPVRDLARRLPIASYPTILKWTEVLIAREEIQSEHYGNIKLVFIDIDESQEKIKELENKLEG